MLKSLWIIFKFLFFGLYYIPCIILNDIAWFISAITVSISEDDDELKQQIEDLEKELTEAVENFSRRISNSFK